MCTIIPLCLSPKPAGAEAYRLKREPLLVNVDRNLVLARALGTDGRVRFQVCSLDSTRLASESDLRRYVDSGLPLCDDVTRSMRLDEPALAEFATHYFTALTRDFELRRSVRIGPVFNVFALSSVFGFSTLALTEGRFGPRAFRLAAAGAFGATVLASHFAYRAMVYQSETIKRRPPSERESNLRLLSAATEVANPANYAPAVVFGCIERALAQASLAVGTGGR